MAQNEPKMAQDEPKTAQDEPKTAQDKHLEKKSFQKNSVLIYLAKTWRSWSKKYLKKLCPNPS